MKILKIFGGVIGAVVLILLVLGLIAPNHTHVERSVTVQAPYDHVWSYVSSFAGMEQWSPWRELDPDQIIAIKNDGAVGALYTWSGNEEVGRGEQTITSMNESEVVTHLHFIEPFEAEADAKTSVEQTDDGVKVTWSYDADSPYPMNVMNLFMDMDEMLGPDFQKGMDKLKVLAEETAPSMNESAFNIETVDLEPRVYVGVRKTIPWKEMESFYASSFESAFGAAEASNLQIVGMPSGVIFKWDEENQEVDMLAGVPLKEGEIEGMDSEMIGGRSLLIEYYGPYEGTEAAHIAVENYLKENGIQSRGIAIEEYVTDPTEQSDSSKWLTKIYYPLVEE